MIQLSQQNLRISLLLLALSFNLIACGENQQAPEQTRISSMHITDQDECHLCGMLIKGFPGPKGGIQGIKNSTMKKFCSNNDLFAYLLQPENTQLKSQAYVHDMAQADWQQPNDEAFVQAQAAWYVIEHQLTGAMGPTIASFASQKAAENFVQAHQGRIIRFEDISLALINQLSQNMHSMESGHH